MIRFFLVTDIHYGLDRKKKLGSKAKGLVEDFVKAANSEDLDCVVDMGDRVNTYDNNTDKRFMKELKAEFNKVSAPIHSILGNHDLHNLSRKENEEIMDSPANSYSREIGGVKMLFFNPGLNVMKHKGLKVRDKDIEWLKAELDASDKPCILFSHIPLDNFEEDDKEALKRDGWPNLSYFERGPEIRKILEDSGKVIACFSGHHHRNKQSTINGIHYITHQSLIQRIEEEPETPCGAYSRVEIDGEEIRITGFGHGQPDRVIAIPPSKKPKPS